MFFNIDEKIKILINKKSTNKMPKMELLIKKVYSNIYSKSNEFLVAKSIKNDSSIKNINNVYKFNEELMHITAEKKDNHKIIHLYSNMNQTLPNASYPLFIQKIDNEEINFNVDIGKLINIILWTKDAFGGVWSYLQ